MKQYSQGPKNLNYRLLPWIIIFLFGWLILPSPAYAFIPHWDPREAFFIRQLAYLFWALAMVSFIFALRQANLQHHRGFRWLAWAAVFFALWNVDCFIGQFIALAMNSQGGAGLTTGTGVDPNSSRIGLWFHYLTKLDHLLLVPAFLCFYLGIRAFSKDPEVSPR
jgi:hypothetical protein